MFKSISTVSVLAAVFALACERTAPDVRDGSVEWVTNRAGADAETVPRLTLTGLDNAFSARLELTHDAGSGRVALPAGLYAINVVPSAAPSGAIDGVVPVQSAPALVVVTAGRLSTVNVRQIEAGTPALAWLDSSER